MIDQETVTINGIELVEGMTLWRFGALRTYNTTLSNQMPDEVYLRLASDLKDYHPDVVSEKSVSEIHSELMNNPHSYDHTEKILFNAMEVRDISCFGNTIEIGIKDWQEERTFSFNSNTKEANISTYCTFEPLEALKVHLGKTIFPASL